MNRLLARKRTKDADSPASETPPELNTTVPRPPSSKGQRRGWLRKKNEPEPEPVEPKVESSLPSEDSFRTSLIMSNLSTRFSMLRDQDDPFSLLGKASDDSVLVPKRRSRLGDLGGFSGGSLSGITERSSQSSQLRPPFAEKRNNSFSLGDGYATDDDSFAGGSIMSRARPGEGNMLFGGRQKIYRIPIGDSGAVNNLGDGDARGMRGRALYEDDISRSTFQKMKAAEKAKEREERLAQIERDGEIEELRKDSLNSPSFRYDERRETGSSTNSGPSMLSQSTTATSTAASVAGTSPGLPSAQPSAGERSKSRKLYEQGLDQHMQEQQAAGLGRLTSTKRAPSANSGTSSPYRSQSANNLRDRFESNGRAGSPHLQAQKPSPTGSVRASPAPGPQVERSNESTPASSRPLSPETTGTEREKAWFQSLEPHDRGMATATGRFNKPKQFSEEQYLQRQMSLLQQQKQAKRPSPSSTNGPPSPSGRSPNQSRPPTASGGRPRAATNRTDRSWSNSSARQESKSFTTGKIEEHPQREEQSTPSEREKSQTENGTFLATEADDGSEYDANSEQETRSSGEQATASGSQEVFMPQQPMELQHPALRSITMPNMNSNREKRQAWSPGRLRSGLEFTGAGDPGYFAANELTPSQSHDQVESSNDEEVNGDLKGLVREHLRHPSNSSSIYPTTRDPAPDHEDFDLRVPSMYVSQNPWADELQPPLPSKAIDPKFSSVSPVSTNNLSAEPTEPSAGNDNWREELNKSHAHSASTETAQEARAFTNELAQRQKIITENMKVKNAPQQRTMSPAITQTPKNVFESSRRPFGMLKPKPSREGREGIRSPHLDQPRPSVQSNRNDRSTSRPRVRGEHGSPAPIGRTLHSKLPARQSEEDLRDSGSSEHHPRMPRPSTEDIRSGRGTPQGRPPRPSPPDTFRVPPPRYRTGFELAHPAERRHQGSDSHPRPSLDTESLRHDSGNGRPGTPLSGSAVDASGPLSNLTASSNSSARLSPSDIKKPMPFSANSTPPLSAVSTPNLINSSSSATTASLMTQSSAGQQEQPSSMHTPSTGFFFPPTHAPSSAATTPTESFGPSSFMKKTPRSRPRKPTISKQDISEPTLIASTNTSTTIDLPEGASLQNGLRDDFDAVLMHRSHADPSAPAPPPSIPFSPTLEAQGGRKKGGGGFWKFGKKERSEEESVGTGEDEPEPRRFRIQRLESETGKVGHRALRDQEEAKKEEEGSETVSPVEGVPGGMI